VITVPMGDHGVVEAEKIEAQDCHVLGEGTGTVACVEEDSLTLELDQGGEAPVLLQRGGSAERIVEDGDPIRTHGVSRQ
jgi:hypothetical protein